MTNNETLTGTYTKDLTLPIAHIESSPRVPLVGENQTEGLIGRSRIQQ